MYLALLCLSFLPMDDTKKDQAALTGTWRVTKILTDKELPPDSDNTTLTFTASEITPKSGGREEWPAKYTLNPAKSPKQIDLHTPQEGTMLGIYEIKGDTLRLSVQRKGARPESFDAKGEGIVYVEAKREKP
jgi:uncharacterized protein (TIGR03067 family)